MQITVTRGHIKPSQPHLAQKSKLQQPIYLINQAITNKKITFKFGHSKIETNTNFYWVSLVLQQNYSTTVI
jgi:hypothetical protein